MHLLLLMSRPVILSGVGSVDLGWFHNSSAVPLMGQLEAGLLTGYWLQVNWGKVGDWVLSPFNSLAWTYSHCVTGF